MDLAADIPLFLADFGVDAIVGGVTVRVIFDNAYQAALGFEASGPAVVGASVDLDAAVNGAPVTIAGGGSYTVSGPPEPDGTGITVLRLQEA